MQLKDVLKYCFLQKKFVLGVAFAEEMSTISTERYKFGLNYKQYYAPCFVVVSYSMYIIVKIFLKDKITVQVYVTPVLFHE